MADTTKVGREAIVIGASMGGLLAARALADHYERVTVIERDAFPEPGEPRKGTPQARHAHGLLARGREALEQLFPGLTDELVAQGASPGDIGTIVRWAHAGRYHRDVQSGMLGLAVSRPLLESHVRARLLALPNVRALQRHDALGIEAAPGGGRIAGVRVADRAAGREEALRADLVVDAAGRGSRAPAWLEALGYQRPPEEQVRIGLGYATRCYRMAPGGQAASGGRIIASDPPGTSGGVLLWQEGGQFIVTLAGYFGAHPPSDAAGFLEFARGLATPDIYRAIAAAEPLGPISTYTYPHSLRRRYERLRRFPEGLLVFGDALCSFNPVYGQGMTAAALQALALGECLGRGTGRLAPRFFSAAARVLDAPWQLAVGNDLRYPQVEAPRPAMTHLVNWYVGRLHVAAWDDAEVALAFLRVLNLVDPPPSLLRPSVALRVAWGNLRHRWTASGPAPHAAAERS